jgi:uncharacterized cupin superfamily protein
LAMQEPLILLEGGERRPAEDGCWYPDVRMVSRGRVKVEPYEEPPPEEADERQVLHVADAEAADSDPEANFELRELHHRTGLRRQRVSWVRMRPQKRFSAFPKDMGIDEWLFVLAGQGRVVDDEQEFGLEANDFLGHPAGHHPLTIVADDHLTFLIGGEATSKA